MDEKRLEEINVRIKLLGIADTPGWIMIGVGYYAKQIADGDAFLPILNNELFVDGMLIVGVAIVALCGFKFFSLLREKGRLAKDIE